MLSRCAADVTLDGGIAGSSSCACSRCYAAAMGGDCVEHFHVDAHDLLLGVRGERGRWGDRRGHLYNDRWLRYGRRRSAGRDYSIYREEKNSNDHGGQCDAERCAEHDYRCLGLGNCRRRATNIFLRCEGRQNRLDFCNAFVHPAIIGGPAGGCNYVRLRRRD